MGSEHLSHEDQEALFCDCDKPNGHRSWCWANPGVNTRDKARLLPKVEALVVRIRDEAVAAARAEVANAFVEWASKNEIAEPPLDWAWFGEIARAYSPLHEEHES